MKERFKNEAFRSGLRYFLIGAAIICFYFFCKNIGVFRGAVDELMRILRPFIIGGIMAYLLCPVYNGTVRFFYVRLHRRLRGKRAMTWARILGTVISMAVLIGLIVAFLALLIPQIFNSIVGLVEVMPGKVSEFSVWVKHMLVESGHRDLADSVDGFINRSTSYGISKLENVFLPGVGSLISKLSVGIINTLKVMLDMLIGLIVCVYVLNGKEILKAKSRRLILVSCGRKRYNGVMDFWNFVNRTFGGFINGKIIDSIIIGIICYVGMLLLKLPYLPDLGLRTAAVRRKYSGAGHSGRNHRTGQLLGHVRHHCGRRCVRRAGYDSGRAYCCGDCILLGPVSVPFAEAGRISVGDHRLSGIQQLRGGSPGCGGSELS